MLKDTTLLTRPRDADDSFNAS